MRNVWITVAGLVVAGLAIVLSACVDPAKIDAQIGEIQASIAEAEELRAQIVTQAATLPPEQVKALGLESQLRIIDTSISSAHMAVKNLETLKEAAVSPDEFVLGISQVVGLFLPVGGTIGILAAKWIKSYNAANSLAESTVAAAANDPDFAVAIKQNARMLDSKQTKLAKALVDQAQRKYGPGKKPKAGRNA